MGVDWTLDTGKSSSINKNDFILNGLKPKNCIIFALNQSSISITESNINCIALNTFF